MDDAVSDPVVRNTGLDSKDTLSAPFRAVHE